jgi:hypothetical protein
MFSTTGTKLLLLAGATILSGCQMVTPASGTLVTPATAATVSELQRNSVQAVQLMVQCRNQSQRLEVLRLTKAQIAAANTSFRNGSLPQGCSPARPPTGTIPEVLSREYARLGRPVWFVDMYYPSNFTRPWLYVVADRRIVMDAYFNRSGVRSLP